MKCGARQTASGSCSACGDDPVLDVHDPNVRSMLLDDDQTRRSNRNDRVRIASVPVSMLVVGGTLAAGAGAYFPAGPFFSYWIGSMIAFALGIMKLVDIVSPFKPKFDDLKD
jgi:hypothetical protein